MASNMKVSGTYGTHLGALISVMARTTGPVLEMGLGIYSTPYLHYQCLLSRRHLVSLDNDKNWVRRFATSIYTNHRYRSPNHELIYVPDWDQADIEKPWDVALIDHSPSERRIIDIRRLANCAKYLVVHDTNPDRRSQRIYRYSEIYPLFKHRKIWDQDHNQATVLSNFASLDNLW